MTLPAVPLVPGVGRGTVRRLENPDRAAESPDTVLYVPRALWTRLQVSDRPARAIVTDLRVLPPGAPPALPTVGGVDDDVVRNGDVAEVDGGAGTLSLVGVGEVRVVTAFLERDDGRILLLRRSRRVGSFRGRWAGVSGFLETPEPVDQARREVEEETGVAADELTLLRSGPPVLARDGGRIYIVLPFRFHVTKPDITLDWEHTEAEWVPPTEIDRRATVPKLGQAWRAVADDPPGRKAYASTPG